MTFDGVSSQGTRALVSRDHDAMRAWHSSPLSGSQQPADEAEPAVLAAAAHDVDEPWLAEWLRDRVQPR